MKPNIIIFNPDQMRADAVSHLGKVKGTTPFLDEFAAEEAVSFRYAFCQNTVCVPSRCSFLTGLYPHVYGHRTMRYLLHEQDSTLFSELKSAGYYVWMNDRNDLLAGQEEELAARHADEIFYAGGNGAPALPGNPDFRGRPGDKNYYSHYIGRLKTDESGRHYSDDDLAVDAAIERLRHPVDDRPVCIFLGLMYPHPPYAVEEPYFSMFDRQAWADRAGIGHHKSYMQEVLRGNMGMAYDEGDYAEMRACYLGMCRKVDDQFKRLCAALKETNQYENSAIFFFSDHGDFTGDYGLPEKAQNCFEDCLTNVPFLVKPPAGVDFQPGVREELIELVDFYATAMDFAGVMPDHDQFGRSLRGLLTGQTAEHRPFVFCEGGRLPHEFQCSDYHSSAGPDGKVSTASMYWPRQMAQTDDRAHAKGTMIRTAEVKYIHRSSGEHEFYDLSKDPLEENNVYDRAEYADLILELRLKMLDWYQATCDIVPRQYDRRLSVEAMWNRVKKSCRPEWEDAIRRLIRDGAGLAMIQAEIERLEAAQPGRQKA